MKLLGLCSSKERRFRDLRVLESGTGARLDQKFTSSRWCKSGYFDWSESTGMCGRIQIGGTVNDLRKRDTSDIKEHPPSGPGAVPADYPARGGGCSRPRRKRPEPGAQRHHSYGRRRVRRERSAMFIDSEPPTTWQLASKRRKKIGE
jgi:hypothetical protein